jgi:hypothetical protein
MASEKNLITKARLEQIKQAEGDLVDNLYQHANASLSKAHGIILYNLPHPFYDGSGNDVSIYKDSHGDRVGYYFMRLTYNNTNYFAPVELSTLPGQDPTTGISATTNVVVPTVIPQGTAWVTDFTPEDEADLIYTNSDVMIPHTKLSHWETHTGGIYQVLPQIITDSAGHRVSNYVARILVNGVELWIPCDLRLGGPVQPMRVPFPAIATIQGTNANFISMGADDDQYGYLWWNAATGGTLPYTFLWQYNTYAVQKVGNWYSDPNIGSGTWVDMPVAYSDTLMSSNPYTCYYKYTLPNKLTLHSSVGSDSGYVVATIRGKYTNAAGSVYTNWCLYKANDEDGSWIFSDPDVNQSAYHVTIKNDPVWVDGYYYPPGPP